MRQPDRLAAGRTLNIMTDSVASIARQVAGMFIAGCIASACASTGAPSSTSSVVPVSAAPKSSPDPQTIELSVKDFAFSTDQLEAEAGRPIIIAFSNEDG